MRICAKMRCGHEPVATVSLRYDDREVVLDDLSADRDPNLLDLCREHVARMTPPVGWQIRDERSHEPVTV
jgi:hypothetical protein